MKGVGLERSGLGEIGDRREGRQQIGRTRTMFMEEEGKMEDNCACHCDCDCYCDCGCDVL